MKRKLYISGLCLLTLLLAVIHPIDAIGIYHHSSGTWYIDTDSNNIFSAGIDQQFQSELRVLHQFLGIGMVMAEIKLAFITMVLGILTMMVPEHGQTAIKCIISEHPAG